MDALWPTAVLADVRGNFTALRAVLADASTKDVARVWFLGGVAADGPEPAECLEQVQTFDCCLASLLDRALCDEPYQGFEGAASARGMHRWSAERLSPSSKAAVRCWPAVAEVGAITMVAEPVGLVAPKLCFEYWDNSVKNQLDASSSALLLARGPTVGVAVVDGTEIGAQKLAGQRLVLTPTQQTILHPGSVSPNIFALGSAHYCILHGEREVEFREVSYSPHSVVQLLKSRGVLTPAQLTRVEAFLSRTHRSL